MNDAKSECRTDTTEEAIAPFQKAVLLTEVTSSVGFQFLAVYPPVAASCTNLQKRNKEDFAIRVQMERIRHLRVREMLVPLDQKSSFIVVFPERSFLPISTGSFPAADGRVRDCYVEPAIIGKTYQAVLQYDLRQNTDSNTANGFPFTLGETLLDSTGNVIRCLRNARLHQKSSLQARKYFEKFKHDFEAEYADPWKPLTSVQVDVLKAQFTVCKDIFRGTISCLKDAEESDSPGEAQRFMDLAVKEFDIERRRDKKPGIIPGAQRVQRNASRRVQKCNKLDREIVANWEACYQYKDGSTFACMIQEATGVKITPKVLRRRQQRLHLATHSSVQTGPKPKS